MRKIFCIVVSLLFLCGCKQSEPAYTDVNVEEVLYFAKYSNLVEVNMERVAFSEQEERGYTSEYRNLEDEKLRKKMGEEISTRLGYMVASPLENEPEEPMLFITSIAECVSSNPNSEFYFIRTSSMATALCFVLTGENTPQAVYVQAGRNFAWYSFDDPVGFVELFWNQAEAVAN